MAGRRKSLMRLPGHDGEHLDRGALVEHSPRSKSAIQQLELGAQRDVKAIGQKVKGTRRLKIQVGGIEVVLI